MEILVAGAGILGIVLAAYFAVRQIRVATTGLLEQRKEWAAQRERQREALLAALKAEVHAIRDAADADLSDFEGYNVSHPRIQQNPSARAVEGENRYWFSFPWTPLPDAAIVEAIREAGLLGLTSSQIQKLQAVQTRILRINGLVQYKVNLYPALMLSNIPRHMPDIYRERPLAEDKAANLNNSMKIEVHAVVVDCAEILKWWEGDADIQSRRAGHRGRRAGRRQLGRIVAAARERISSRLSALRGQKR